MLLQPILPLALPVTLTYVGATHANGSASFALSASLLAGDIGILLDGALNGSGSNPTAVVPTGWTNLVNETGGGSRSRFMVSRKILVTGDISATITGMSFSGGGSSDTFKTALIFRPSRTLTGAAASAWNVEYNAGNPASQSVLGGAGQVPLIVFGYAAAFGTGTSPAFSTESPAFDATLDNGSDCDVGYKIYNSAPANHTIDMNDIGDNLLASGYVRVT